MVRTIDNNSLSATTPGPERRVVPLFPNREQEQKHWSDMSICEKAEQFAKTGNFTSVAGYLVTNAEDIYPNNVELKKLLLINALQVAANIALRNFAQGIYIPQAYEYQEIAEALPDYAAHLQARAVEVAKLTTEEELIEYIRDWLPHTRLLEFEKTKNHFFEKINQIDIKEIEELAGNFRLDYISIYNETEILFTFFNEFKVLFNAYLANINAAKGHYDNGRTNDYQIVNQSIGQQWKDLLTYLSCLNEESDYIGLVVKLILQLNGILESVSLPETLLGKKINQMKITLNADIKFVMHNLGKYMSSLIMMSQAFESAESYYKIDKVAETITDFERDLNLLQQAIIAYGNLKELAANNRK